MSSGSLPVAEGDSNPVSVGSSRFTIDFESSPGGVVSASRVYEDAPAAPAIEYLNGYWDIHTDMLAGTFVAQITFDLQTELFPPEVNPSAIAMAMYDPAAQQWTLLETTIDVLAGTATITTDRLSKFVAVESEAVATLRASWGSVKARF